MNSELLYKTLEKIYLSEDTLEKDVLCNLHLLLDSEAIFVDVGANIGQYTAQANQIIEKGSIYAIEADPTRFAFLKKNCKKWETLSYNTIQTLNIAISHRNHPTEPFYITNSPVSGCGVKYDLSNLKNELRDAVDWQKITVTSYKIDTLFKAIEPDLIKIATGGSELQILQGATNILKKGTAKFLIELYQQRNPKISNYNREELCNFMRRFGYESKPFYTKSLFVNPQKILLNQFKKACFQMLPKYARRRWG